MKKENKKIKWKIIEPKYKLGQIVYSIKDYNLFKGVVVGIHKNTFNPDEDKLSYDLIILVNSKGYTFVEHQQEYIIFATEEELTKEYANIVNHIMESSIAEYRSQRLGYDVYEQE